MTAVSLWEAPVKSKSAQPQTAELRIGEVLELTDGNTSLVFAAVENDSRCPKGARCIRPGEAVVILQLHDTRGVTALTFKVPPDADVSQSAGGYRITVIRLAPEAELEREIAPGDYLATIAVQKTP